eukprot:1640173-Ditylum_brightwellii.AAC.1
MESPERFIQEELGGRFTPKEKLIGKPSQYLGNKVSEVELKNGNKRWSFNSSLYVQNTVKEVEDYLCCSG